MKKLYTVVQHHKHTADAVGGAFGVYDGDGPNPPAVLLSAHDTEKDARNARTRYVAADTRRLVKGVKAELAGIKSVAHLI